LVKTRKYIQKELEKLKQLYEKGESIADISKALNRKRKSIQSKIYYLMRKDAVFHKVFEPITVDGFRGHVIAINFYGAQIIRLMSSPITSIIIKLRRNISFGKERLRMTKEHLEFLVQYPEERAKEPSPHLRNVTELKERIRAINDYLQKSRHM